METAFTEPSRIIRPSILYFGTPVVLLSTRNEDGSTNLTPMSSAWALGHTIVLGLGANSHGLANMMRHGECVVNLPNSSLWEKIERLAPLTGANPIPPAKQARHVKDKFAFASLTELPSRLVQPSRVGECPLQVEAVVRHIQHATASASYSIIEVEAVQVHAHESIVFGENHVDPSRWNPLIYNFRHYFGLGEELGKSFKSET